MASRNETLLSLQDAQGNSGNGSFKRRQLRDWQELMDIIRARLETGRVLPRNSVIKGQQLYQWCYWDVDLSVDLQESPTKKGATQLSRYRGNHLAGKS